MNILVKFPLHNCSNGKIPHKMDTTVQQFKINFEQCTCTYIFIVEKSNICRKRVLCGLNLFDINFYDLRDIISSYCHHSFFNPPLSYKHFFLFCGKRYVMRGSRRGGGGWKDIKFSFEILARTPLEKRSNSFSREVRTALCEIYMLILKSENKKKIKEKKSCQHSLPPLAEFSG